MRPFLNHPLPPDSEEIAQLFLVAIRAFLKSFSDDELKEINPMLVLKALLPTLGYNIAFEMQERLNQNEKKVIN